MNNTTPIELIERYLLGRMSDEERKAFENRLADEPLLAQEAEEYAELLGALKAFGREKAFRAKLKSIHKNADDVRLKALSHTRTQGMRGLPQLILTGAVAASIALLVMIGAGEWILGKREMDPRAEAMVREMSELRGKVAQIDSMLLEQNPEIKSMDVSFGTAFPVASNGYVLTSYHIVKDAQRIWVELPGDGNSRFRAELFYSDPTMDLAVLRVYDTNFTSFGVLPYGLANAPSRLGEFVYTLGYSKQDVVFTEGSISSMTGFEEDTFAYQISVPVNPGNSGGPLMNAEGQILGLISGKHSQQEGAAFATKSSHILSFLNEMKSDSSLTDFSLPKGQTLKWKERPAQVEKLQELVFRVRVYSR